MGWDFFSVETIQALAREYGYWAVFLGIALENTGVPLPGETITLVGGFLAGSGELNYWGVLLAAVTGAVLGDNCGYWIGRWGGWPFLVRAGRLLRIKEHQLLVARQQFSKNAPGAVFFGRFVALLRIFAGPMAGIAQMPYPQFLLCNFGGAALWATLMVSLSFFLGHLIPLTEIIHWAAQLGIFALLAVVGAVAVGILWKRRQARAEA
ncbi:MAG: DedA family protein [Cyanobacteria bacterium RI_101]|nr:DedA family protein [Cyanobacteria bacterium RI_101]